MRSTFSLSVRQSIVALCMAVFLSVDLTAIAQAQSAPIIYPSAGQSMDQQGRDEAECRNWATQQTGIYPNQAPPAYYGNSYEQGAPVLRGAARGAALGAVGGAIGGDAGKGAAIGAGVGATAGVIRKNQARRQEAQINQQAAAQYQADMGRYNQAFAVCMQGRGYAVQ